MYKSSRHTQKQLPCRLLSIDPSKFEDELQYGLDAANELLSLVRKRKSANMQTAPEEELVFRTMKSFATTLSMLRAEVSGGYGGGKSSTRNRKRKNAETKVTQDLIHDGYVWRKYGEKDIHLSEFPRNYYRCTYKHDGAGCQATKQVQQISQNPTLYATTYKNQHTCNQNLNPPQITFDQTPPILDESSLILSFQTNSTHDQQCTNHNQIFSSPAPEHNTRSLSSNYCPSLQVLTDQMLLSDLNGEVVSVANSPSSTSLCSFNGFEDAINFSSFDDDYWFSNFQ